MKNHTDFILSSITEILKDAVSACSGIGTGIEAYPLFDYIMQSVFLKMTGFQEQKMKCICWELATNDYEYRYGRFYNDRNQLGECSSYKDKNEIYKDLVNQIKNFMTQDERGKILTNASSEITNTFSGTNLSIWAQKSFNEYNGIWKDVEIKHFAVDNNTLLAEINGNNPLPVSLKKIYNDHLYKHRNRCAHNTHSYQQNLPTLKILAGENYQYENYFIYFAILILIDYIFIELYKKYLEMIEA